MKSVLKIIAVLILFAAASCADANKTSPDIQTTVIDQTVLDSATVLVIDSADQRFAHIVNSNQMLVYQDSLLIVSHSYQTYGEPIISLYDRGNPLRRLANYIPRGSDTDEMVACGIHIAGDELFVSDSYYTGRYCSIPLKKLPPADELHLSPSGVEERGVAITPVPRRLTGRESTMLFQRRGWHTQRRAATAPLQKWQMPQSPRASQSPSG